MSMIELCERGLVPDALTRYGIRRLCAQRLAEEGRDRPEVAQVRQSSNRGEIRRTRVA
jgi:cyclopropane-fatty-acyl-phospholipid synthase